MRLAFLTPGFCATEDDWSLPVLRALAREMARQHELTIFSLRYPARQAPYDVRGLRVIPFGGGGTRRLARAGLYLRALRGIQRETRRRRFDMIHAFWAHEPGFIAALAGRRSRTPFVVSILGGELVDLPEIDYGGGQSAANRFFARYCLPRAARVIVGSEFQRRLAAPYVRPERLLLRTLGVDTELFRPGPPSAGAPRLEGDPKLLHVASLCPVKDQATLLTAFAQVAERLRGAVLHIVGDGELRGALEQRTAELGLARRVRFHGEVEHRRLPDYYRQADLSVLSSRSENSALVVLESAACGTPVVGTAVGLLPDLGTASRTVPPGDARALGELLWELLRAEDARAEMAREGSAIIDSQLNLARTTAELSELYAKIAENSSKIL